MANFDQQRVREGMVVWSFDDEKLGKVLQCDEQSFLVEKGFFFPKDYALTYDEISEIRDDGIHVRLSKSALESGERYREGATGGTASLSAPEEEIRMPLAEEQLQVEKTRRPAGEVRVNKEVVTESRQVTVPVQREQVTVEHVPVSERPAAGSEAAFRGETISVPVEEEEVEITKRPVVREEVRVQKTPYEEQRTASESVRREVADVDVDHEGEVRREGRPLDDTDEASHKKV